MTKGRGALLAVCASLMTDVRGRGDAGGGGGGSSNPPAPTVQYHPAGASIPTSGTAVLGVEVFDQAVMAFMRQWNVPGAAVAVAKDGKLLLARGYGHPTSTQRW